MRTLFVTATGTGVGKTYVTAALIRALRARGRAVRALKPVASGFDAARPEDSDPGKLLEALGLPVDGAHLDRVAPWRFAAPLSPDMAAAREGRWIDWRRLIEFCRVPDAAGGARFDTTLIEGVGGVMVPLDARHTVLDWIAALEAPALLVAGSYLGTLSHTLTAVAALRGRACALAGIVVDESPEQPVPAEETAAAIERLADAPVAVVPRMGSVEEAGRRVLALVSPHL